MNCCTQKLDEQRELRELLYTEILELLASTAYLSAVIEKFQFPFF